MNKKTMALNSTMLITLVLVLMLTDTIIINRQGGGGVNAASSGSKNFFSSSSSSNREKWSGKATRNSRILPEIENSIRVEKSEEKIKLKLSNGQILVGNRKVIDLYRQNNHPSPSSSSSSSNRHHDEDEWLPAGARVRAGGMTMNASQYSYYRTGTNRPSEQRIVYEFLGVPFAKAPVGPLRFQFPQRLNKVLTEDIYNATYFRPSCYQEYDQTFPDFPGSEMWNPAHGVSEDCLYFNIWVPVTIDQDELLYKRETIKNVNKEWNINYIMDVFRLGARSLKASLFWVYGGSFSSGSANLNITDGTLLAGLENVIIVTFNYRVGPFGFLYMNNSIAPGNAGLADQVMVVEWFRENYMRYFGADENSICMFGESAGAMSLHYLMLTEKANLFKRLIFQSSSSYSDLTYRPPSDAYRISLRLAERLNCLLVYHSSNETTSSSSSSSSSHHQHHRFDTEEDETPLNIRQTRRRAGVHTLDQLSYNDLIKQTDFNTELVKCLMNARAEDISLAQFDIDYVNDYLKMQFIPTLDYHGLIKVDPNEIDFKTAPEEYRSRLNHDILVGINKDEGTYFTVYLFNSIYFNLQGFLSPNNTKYDNKFVYDRLKEAFRTRYPAVVDEARHLRVESLQFRSNPKFDHKIAVLTLKRRAQDTTLIKTSRAVDEYFYEQFIHCLSDMYKHRNPSLVKDIPAAHLPPNGPKLDKKGRNLYDLDNNVDNQPDLAWNKINKIIGDYVFSCPTIKLAANYSLLNPNRTFFYKFNKRSLKNPWPIWTGVLHGYEIEYIFGVPWLQDSQFDAEDRRVSRRIMSYWANFAKYGRLYSNMDITQRRYFVQFSRITSSHNEQMSSEHDEEAEYEFLNRMYENCGFMGKLNRHQSYATKYEMCMNMQDRIIVNSATTAAHSSFFLSSSFSSFFFSFVVVVVYHFCLSHLVCAA